MDGAQGEKSMDEIVERKRYRRLRRYSVLINQIKNCITKYFMVVVLLTQIATM